MNGIFLHRIVLGRRNFKRSDTQKSIVLLIILVVDICKILRMSQLNHFFITEIRHFYILPRGVELKLFLLRLKIIDHFTYVQILDYMLRR